MSNTNYSNIDNITIKKHSNYGQQSIQGIPNVVDINQHTYNNNNNNNTNQIEPEYMSPHNNITVPTYADVDTDLISDINEDNIENTSKLSTQQQKYSLSHYMSTIFTVTMTFFITSTALLLIWSNQKNGAYVEVKAFPIKSTEISTFNENEFINFIEKQFYMKLINNNNTNLYDSNSLPNCDGFGYCGNVFQFSLTSSINDFWQSNAYSLAFVIALFSGLWPYVKLVLLALMLLYPVEQRKRTKILMILDQLGKYSFIDLYVTVFMIVSFYVQIIEKAKTMGIEIDVVVECDVGLTSFTIATVASMFYSMIFIFADTNYAEPEYMRDQFYNELIDNNTDNNDKNGKIDVNNIINKSNMNILDSFRGMSNGNANESPKPFQPISPYNNTDNNKQIHKKSYLNENKFNKILNKIENDENIDINKYKTFLVYKTDPHKNIGPLYMFYNSQSIMGIIHRSLLITLMLINVYGIWLSVNTAPVRFDIQGLAGAFVTDNIRSYSVLKNGNLLDSATDTKIAATMITYIYYLTVIICPILTMFLTALLWILPCKMNYHNIFHKYKHILFILQAWSALDVFVIGCVAISVEIGAVSNWIINTNFAAECEPGVGIIPKIFGVGCFSVKGNLIFGTFLILIVVIIEWYTIIYTFIFLNKTDIDWNMKFALEEFIHKKEDKSKDKYYV